MKIGDTPTIVDSRMSFIDQRSLNIGIVGCIISLVFRLAYEIVYLRFRIELFLGVSYNRFWWTPVFEFTALVSFTISCLLAIGFYGLLTRTGSKLGIPFAILFILPSASWIFWFPIGLWDIAQIYIILFDIVIAVILGVILWSIRGSVSNRGLLTGIVLLFLFAPLSWHYIDTLLWQILNLTGPWGEFYAYLPSLTASFIQTILSGFLFYKENSRLN